MTILLQDEYVQKLQLFAPNFYPPHQKSCIHFMKLTFYFYFNAVFPFMERTKE